MKIRFIWPRAFMVPVCLLALPIFAAMAQDRAVPAAPASGGIAAKLQPFVDKHKMAGAVVLVADKDKVLDVETVGYADLTAQKPMAADDMFWIASMSKPMTVTALMMLVDEGKVNVDDPVEKYLPYFKGQMVADSADPRTTLHPQQPPILVRNLLSHTSGLPLFSPVEKPTLDLLPLSEAVPSYARTVLMFEPGTKYSYSNAGINTAGRIIEVVSGMPYEKFMEERLFKPLGMKDTTFWPNEEQLQRLAKSYRENAQKDNLEETDINYLHYPLNDVQHRFPMPAGSLFHGGRRGEVRSNVSQQGHFPGAALSVGSHGRRDDDQANCTGDKDSLRIRVDHKRLGVRAFWTL